MPREKDPFWDYVESLPNKEWKCNFCNNKYSGSVTRIKAHLAGVPGLGIQGCKDVDAQVRSEASIAMKGKGAAESSNGLEVNAEEGLPLPVSGNYEDAGRATSVAHIPYLSCDVTNAVGASSSAFHSSPEMNLAGQSLPAQNTIPGWDTLSWSQPPQPLAGGSSIQLRNFSVPSSHPDLQPEALTNVPRPLNAGGGEPNTEVPRDVSTYDAPVDGQLGICGLVDEDMPTLKRKLKELSNREAEMLELEALCRKTKTIKGEYWSMVRAFREGRPLALQQKERVDDLSKAVEEVLGHCSFQKGSATHAAGCREIFPLVTTELVGDESQATIRNICNYLMKHEIFIIGICGMGGVGKTAILMHVHNRMLENRVFSDVFWITVPQEFSVYELQDEIANVVGLDNLSKFKDVKRRACILKKHLEKKRAVLILDDLWMHFDVEDVGIPIEKGGIKLVLTTRSQVICHKMLCQEEIIIYPLLEEEDWSLFLKKFSSNRKLSSEVEETARSIVGKCGGLPLGIIEVATRMRRVEEVHEWRAMLRKLKDLSMELDVFKSLKLSYTNLGDPQVQQCFLHLVLCFGFEERPLCEKELVESFIDEGLLGGIGTRQELHDQGKPILDTLRKSFLWENGDYIDRILRRYRLLHPLTRDMALHMVSSTTHMVKARMELGEIPEEKFWTDSLEKVYLQGNHIKEIPYGISPNCPKLTRLSLNDNVSLEAIDGSFFRHLKGLKVVDFSHTGLKELADAISDLTSLEALLLRGCEKLRRIPCVRKLESLKKLDLNGCSMIEEVPEGMEMLVNLSYLDLHGTKIETLPERVLGKLVNLQYVVMTSDMDEEWTKLKVEGLYCVALNVETFNAWVRFLEHSSFRQYNLLLRVSGHCDFEDADTREITIESCQRIAARGDGEIGGGGRVLLPKNVQRLEVRCCDGMTSLCEVGPLDHLEKLEIVDCEELEEMGDVHFPKLRELEIRGCSKLKRLEEGQGLPCLEGLSLGVCEELEGINIAAPNLKRIEVLECTKMKRVVEWGWLNTSFRKLESMEIFHCEELKEITAGPLPSGATCFLNHLLIRGCNNLKGALLTHDMLRHLPHLRDIRVDSCKDIEAIAGTVPDEAHSSFPNLTSLTLHDLPELSRICDGTMSCPNLTSLTLRDLPELSRICDGTMSCPNLTSLTLRDLPELSRICDGTMSCDSIKSIDIWKCPKLKRIPLQLRPHPLYDSLLSPPRSLQEILMVQEQWESLEWDHPLARSSLEPLVKFQDWRLQLSRHISEARVGNGN